MTPIEPSVSMTSARGFPNSATLVFETSKAFAASSALSSNAIFNSCRHGRSQPRPNSPASIGASSPDALTSSRRP